MLPCGKLCPVSQVMCRRKPVHIFIHRISSDFGSYNSRSDHSAVNSIPADLASRYAYSLPFQQYVQIFSGGNPIASSMSFNFWNFRLVKFSLFLMHSSMHPYFLLSGSLYSSRHAELSPSSSLMTRLVIRSISERDLEKFKYLHPNSSGGHANLM